jgi:hypothetical protein
MDRTSERDDDVRYRLVHAYDSDDPEFVRGAEVGALEAKVQLLGDVVIHDVMRRSNEEMVRRIAEGAGRAWSAQPIDETWMDVTLEAPADTSSPRARTSLRAVD